MFKRVRIAILLYILLFVALGQFLAGHRSTSWERSLRVNIYPVNGSETVATQAYIDALTQRDLAELELFFTAEAGRFGLELPQPVRFRLAEQLDRLPPPIPAGAGAIGTIVWSLKMRWYVTRLHWTSDSPTPDITVLAIFHDGDAGASLDRSTALRKGLTAIANLFGERSSHGGNLMIIAHELLHTLGASDKYDLATGYPLYPIGYAEPERAPRYPQTQAELMAGRIPLSSSDAAQPDSLRKVLIGPYTAWEIGWLSEPPAPD